MNKIAYLYSSYYPIRGGGNVHGYYLAKALANKGYILYNFNKIPDNCTVNIKRTLKNILMTIKNSDVVYLRLNLKIDSKYLLLILAKLLKRKVIIELNSPSDELRLSGAGDLKIIITDIALRFAVKLSDHLIVVSKNVKKYSEEVLKAKNITVIPNGGHKFSIDYKNIDQGVAGRIKDLKNTYNKIAVWSGTKQPWQGYDIIKDIICKSNNTIAYIIISNDNTVFEEIVNDNVYFFNNLARKEVEYIISQSNIGLSLYGDYGDYGKYGFYGSSIKFREYLINGLFVIANPNGQMLEIKQENLFLSFDVDEILKCMYDLDVTKKYDTSVCRSWDDVAEETDRVIQSVLKKIYEK